MFGRIFCDEKISSTNIIPLNKHVYYQLDYALTTKQKEISMALVNNFMDHKNSVVMAVCGSGKTEIIYDVLTHALNHQCKVCVAIPRKTLVTEIGERIKRQFKNVEPALFYGGQQGDVHSPLVVCTTHQLYRFYQSFDLLILDETDAFPYSGDPLLQDLLFSSLKGNYIFMSATLDSQDYPNTACYVLNRRYHQVDLPFPKVVYFIPFLWNFYILYFLKKWQKPTLIYVPRINDLEKFTFMFKQYRFASISSKTNRSDELIDKLRNNQLDFIVATTILERGITIEDVQVIVLEANHIVYTKEVLLQIAGRVGRSPKHPTGEVVFLSTTKNKAIKECLKTISKLNKNDV